MITDQPCAFIGSQFKAYQTTCIHRQSFQIMSHCKLYTCKKGAMTSTEGGCNDIDTCSIHI